MFLLDTNVISELLRPTPTLTVVRWLEAQPRAALHIGTVTQAELLEGVARMPAGRKQAALAAAVRGIVDEDFAGQVLPFDSAAAASYAALAARRRKSGRPIAIFDGLIAAICHARSLTLVTRNIADFQNCGLRLVDPWNA